MPLDPSPVLALETAVGEVLLVCGGLALFDLDRVRLAENLFPLLLGEADSGVGVFAFVFVHHWSAFSTSMDAFNEAMVARSLAFATSSSSMVAWVRLTWRCISSILRSSPS